MTEQNGSTLKTTATSFHLVNERMVYSHKIETVTLREAVRRAVAANKASTGGTIETVLLTRNEGETYFNGEDDPQAVVPPSHARIETIRMIPKQPVSK